MQYRLQHLSMLSDPVQHPAVHAVHLAVRFQERGIIAAGDEGLLFLHAGEQILLAPFVQLAQHIIQQQYRVLPGDCLLYTSDAADE